MLGGSMKYFVFPLFFLVTLTSISFNCSENTVDSTDLLPPGRRDYIWTVDTLSYSGSYQTLMNVIWGKNSNNLWVAGHNESGFGKMYHFNGEKWIPVELIDIPTPIFYSILGLDENNIFIAGSANYIVNSTIIDSSLVIHFDGDKWNSSLLNEGRSLFSITGNDNDVYAAGLDKSFFHFDGVNWTKIEMDFYTPSDFQNHYASSILKRTNLNMIMNYVCIKEALTLNYFLEYKGINWVKIDSFFNTSNNISWGKKFWESPQGSTYSVNPSFYKLNGIKWERVIIDDNIYTAVNGTDEKNLFIAGQKVFHFNGNDWYEFKDISLNYGNASAIHCVDNEVFIVFSDGIKSFIVRGK